MTVTFGEGGGKWKVGQTIAGQDFLPDFGVDAALCGDNFWGA